MKKIPMNKILINKNLNIKFMMKRKMNEKKDTT